MNWDKLGLVFNPEGKFSWAKDHALQPTPLVMADRVRIYSGFRDEAGVSRVGFVDHDINDLRKILAVSQYPVLDIGMPGAFDENGVVPCRLLRVGKKTYLYYAGYQLGQKVKFTVYGGLAISEDGGQSFTRSSTVPITDRTDGEELFRVIHSVIEADGRFKAWYGAGNRFIDIDGKPFPTYNIRYMESDDGIKGWSNSCASLDFKDEDEYRVARPWVMYDEGIYKLFYYIATKKTGFRLEYAESRDGINWENCRGLGIEKCPDGFDSEMISYPSAFRANEDLYVIYNGNEYGRYGYGIAKFIA